MFDISESGKEIGEKLFILLSTKQQQELKQFIMDIECGKIRLADILSCSFGSHVICCMNKNAGKAKFEIEKDDLFFSLEQRLVMIQNRVTEMIYKGLATLSEKQRQRIYARYFLGMSQTEIARVENCSKISVHQSINRGLKQLQEYFLKNNL